MKALLVGSVVAALVALQACTGDDPAPLAGDRDAGASSEAAAPVVPALEVKAPPRVFVPPNIATDVVVTITRTGFDGPVKLEIDKLPAGVSADASPTIPAGETTATIRLSTGSSTQAFARAKVTATFAGPSPLTVSVDVEVTLRGRTGDVDTTFGESGVIDLTPAEGAESIRGAVADSAGRMYLLVPDLFAPQKCRVFRTTPNGAIDASGWGTNGIVEFRRPAGGSMVCSNIALQADGKVLVGGHDDKSGSGDVAWVARITGTPGSASFLDATYGSGGFALTNGVAVYTLAVDPQDRALVRGGTASGNYLRRITTAGVIDSGFALPSNLLDTLSGALLATASGAIYGAREGGAEIFRVNESGALDTSLGSGGFLKVPKPPQGIESELHAFRIDGKGRIIGIGKTDLDASTSGGAVVRIDGDRFDPTFGPAGQKTGLAYLGGVGQLQFDHAVVDESDGIIAASNEERSTNDVRVILTRFVDGEVDTLFSPGGYRTLPTVGETAEVRGLVLQEQRIVVLLLALRQNKFRAVLVRLWR